MTFVSRSIIVNYLIWRVTLSLATLLNKEMRLREFKFKKVLTGIKTLEERWRECVKVVLKSFPISTSALYVKKYFKKESKEIASSMVDSIKDEFLDILKEVTWMDERTKAAALNKATKIRAYVGYPDELLDDSKLIEYYGNMEIDEKKYFEAMIQIEKFHRTKSISKLREFVNKTDWEHHAAVAVVNAFYNPLENTIREENDEVYWIK